MASREDAHPPARNFRGVSFDPHSRLWRARFYCLGRHVTLGRYHTASEAALVHDRAAHFVYGDVAQTNYGIDAARRSNMREPPSASWRIMNTLQSLADAQQQLTTAAQARRPPRGPPWGDMYTLPRQIGATLRAGAEVVGDSTRQSCAQQRQQRRPRFLLAIHGTSRRFRTKTTCARVTRSRAILCALIGIANRTI